VSPEKKEIIMFFGIPMWVVILAFIALSGFRIVMEYERGVIFRLGRIRASKGAGVNWIIPIVDRMIKISMRTITMDIPPQDVITKDNISIKVNAVVYFKVTDANLAILKVEDYLYATSQLAQTTLRSILGQHDMDELLSDREKLNQSLQTTIDKQTDAWGIKVAMVEIKQIDIPEEMRRAMARQAEAERERRSKVISAQGEFEASAKLKEAADVMGANPITLQLRYLQTMNEIASENNTRTIIPIPLDLFQGLLKK
jgi:regulator of protease activity HflC (stomatin/prohibitin superfamily)